MTLSNEKRRERYNNDEVYRNKILNRDKKKYHEDEIYRSKKIKDVIEYNKSHPVKRERDMRQYYIDHADHLKLSIKLHRGNKRIEVLYWYSNGLMKCNHCDDNNFEFLCIDHIDNNGGIHREEMGNSGGAIYRYLINNNFPDGYQVLCNNCNYLKEYDKVHSKILSQTKYAIAIRKQRLNIRLQTLYWYSNGLMKCDCCNENNIRLLTIDHINGSGKQHVIKNKIKNLYEHLYYNNYPDGYKVLCWNCNKSYGQYGYCPHCNIFDKNNLKNL